MEILVTSSIIPYLKILYPHMGPPVTPGPQVPHHLNPVLLRPLDVVVSPDILRLFQWFPQ